ncbi:unnamed protein product [Rangifer tarandus platyrhynchus]|uniref:Uncharacterized protein n=1 Tax=Rangifer tarandus platyrhynchus TaxID=3082113 RepID=A0ABN8YHK5_RANTA|nr:unnamed protein product [Rangifer tarandus platyrhynchus]
MQRTSGLLPDGRGTGTGLDVRVTKRKMLKKRQPWPLRVLQGGGAHGLLLPETQPLLWSWNEQQLSRGMSPSSSSSLARPSAYPGGGTNTAAVQRRPRVLAPRWEHHHSTLLGLCIASPSSLLRMTLISPLPAQGPRRLPTCEDRQ